MSPLNPILQDIFLSYANSGQHEERERHSFR
jgi:hypothetical protein